MADEWASTADHAPKEEWASTIPVTAPKHWSERLGLTNDTLLGTLGGQITDALEGAASGAASTMFKGGDLIRRATGMERVIDRPEVKQAMTAPPTVAGTLGKFGEQAAEFVGPGGLARGLGKGLATGALGRAALEAGAAGGVTAAQTGGEPIPTAIGAVTGGAASLLPEVAPALKNWAQAQYGRFFNPTKEATKYLSKNEVVPEMLERGVTAWSQKGLQSKVGTQVAKYGQMIGDEWANLPPGTMVNAEPILQRMGQTATEMHTVPGAGGVRIPMGPEAERGLANSQALAETIRSMAEPNPQTGVLEIGADRLRKVKQYFDDIAARAGRYQGKDLADASIAEAHGLAADAARSELAKDFPDIAKLNKEFSFWKDVQKVVDETVQRRVGQAKPLGRKLAEAAGTAGGFATGGVHGAAAGKTVMGALEALVNSPIWRTKSAVYANRIADALASGNQDAAMFYITKAAGQAGISAAGQ